MSNIDLILLGLIKQKSQSAYDIKKNIEYRNIPRWVKISEQSIYKKVLQLESKEYIVSHKEKEGNMPDKAIYTITNKGNDYFNKLMNDISNSDVSLYLDFNVIITNLDLVDEFNENPSIKVFLISLKAGGTGLNLTGADMVIHYDPWWNLSTENQATDRAYRIGQKNNVQVYKLITKNSIEEKIYELQQKKAELIDNMLSTKTSFINTLSKEDIMRLFEE